MVRYGTREHKRELSASGVAIPSYLGSHGFVDRPAGTPLASPLTPEVACD